MNGLIANTIIKWPDVPKPRYDRILQINSSSATMVIIDVTDVDNDDVVHPVIVSCEEIEEAIRTSKAFIVETDLYRDTLRPKVNISEEEKKKQQVFWKAIEPIVNHTDVFDPHICVILIRNAVTLTGINRKTIRKLLRRFWRGGQTPEALLSRYYRCGTGRKSDKKKDYKKLGKKRTAEGPLGTPVGVNMDPVAERHFRAGIKLYYENEKGRTLLYAYRKTIETYFHTGKYPKHGVEVRQLPDSDEVPSYDQFVYFYKKNQNVVDATLAREGQHAYDLNHRAIPGNSTLDADGPGHTAQLDPTVGDVYLVSEFDRTRIIGRPIIYIIIDVFTRLIIGMSVSLEAPSWLGATLALENMVRDKVDYCQEYGFTITEADWPSHDLPKYIIADRGELLSKNSDLLGEMLGITVINTPPYRPDWKPIVERFFRVLNDEVIKWVPGAVHEYLPRSGNDYRYDACLTLFDLRQLLIGCVIEHNIAHEIKDYPKDKYMIADNVQAYPAQLWKWGIDNRRGKLRKQPPADVRVKLLSKGVASITAEGIRFDGLYYECELAWNEKWFERARIQGRESVQIGYDKRTVAKIYLRLDSGRQIEECTLMPKDQMWAKFDWQDMKDRRVLNKMLVKEPAQVANQIKVEIHTKQEQILLNAQQKTALAKEGLSKADLTRGLEGNRAEALKNERMKDLQMYDTVSASSNASSTQLTREEIEEDAFMVEQNEWLRKMRDKGSNNA